jgi:hypothetical protein
VRPTALAVTLAVSLVAFAGCLEDPGTKQTPPETDSVAPATVVHELPEAIAGFEETTVLSTPAGGNGLWIDRPRDILVQSMGGGGVLVADIADPANPKVLSHVDDVYARDVDIMRWDNRTIAVLAGSGDGIHLLDVTDPTMPELLSSTTLPVGAHNIAVVPGTPYVYNSGAGGIHVLDASEFFEPTYTEIPIPESLGGVPVTTDGCHDVTVRVDLGQAYCAGGGGQYMRGGGETFIWDISKDPREPKWVGMIENPFMVYHHQALASHDGSILIIDDEHIAPNCAHVEAAGVNVFDTPTGAVWFYDISDPGNPVMLSHIQPPASLPPAANCGSHFGDLVDGHDVLAMGFYGAGTILVDFSDPASPRLLEVHPPVSSTWDARYHNGHVFTGSGDVQVLRLV